LGVPVFLGHMNEDGRERDAAVPDSSAAV
jgi:hypothetical protein